MDINDITYAIRGAIFEVNNVLGPGFMEKVYENSLSVEWERLGYKVIAQVPLKVLYKNIVVGDILLI